MRKPPEATGRVYEKDGVDTTISMREVATLANFGKM